MQLEVREEKMTRDDLIVAATCGTGLEADMMSATLAEAGIPFQVSSARAGIFGAGFAGPIPGGFTILVPVEFAEQARTQLGVATEES
jgi:hypothetical protein